ncbi:ANTAR domain-containing protein [Geodermatophilus sp. CPCC 205506]|uniref:ANTAR domain-containing protein n=1 Tax=Geodermatophilus sp. CPCC 205506 TaxID=2936596 RepID=UPI003EEB0CB5
MTGPADNENPAHAPAAYDGLSHLLLAEEDPQSVLQRVVDQVKRAMPDGAEASITVLRDDRPTTAAFTGDLALDLDETQYGRGHGPCLDAAFGSHIVEIVDGRAESRWPDYIPTFLDRGAVSSIAVPVPAAGLVAGLNVYAPSAQTFSEQDRQTVVELASYAAVVLTNMDTLQDARELAENLQKALEFRSVIEQAKGILIERFKLTPDEAFRLLAEASMHNNRKVRDIAETLVLTGSLEVRFPLPDGATSTTPHDSQEGGRR